MLSNRISIDVTNRRLSDVLKLISNRGNFYFSYNSAIINRDSLVTIAASNKTVQQVLEQLFGNTMEYRVRNNYIILRKIVAPPGNVAKSTATTEKLYTITGYVLNSETGEKVSNVSIYEKQRLVSALTDENGYFILKLKSRYSSSSLTVSRYAFEDTVVSIRPKFDQELTIILEPVQFNYSLVTISPMDYERPDSISITPALNDSIGIALPITAPPVTQVERTKVGLFLLSTKQRIQSLNLGEFFANRPFQASLIPGLSTRGKLSGQVVNNFSLNLLGGYTGGVRGIELGGLFNIVKQDVRYVQAAGIVNVAGGPAWGVQLAGINNTVLSPVIGVQAAGINNFVKGKMTGIQASGIHNHVTDSVSGVQFSGISNYARDKMAGAQFAGIGNFANRTISGLQVAGIFNYAKRLKGVQIGLINICDTSEGYSIGLINFVLKGYHKLDFSHNETFNANLGYKSGNKKLYSILELSGNPDENQKAFAVGYGFGSELAFGKSFSLNPEVTAHYLYLGDEEKRNILGRITLQLQLKLFKYVSIHAGPAFVIYNSNQTAGVEGYKFPLPSANYHTFSLWDNETIGWVGWNAGISLF